MNGEPRNCSNPTLFFLITYSKISLTQLRSLAEDKSIGPEFGDRGAVETVVTHGLSEAAGCEDVRHVKPRPDGSYDTKDESTFTLKQHFTTSSTTL